MAWLVLACGAVLAALALRWAASAMWVRLITDRWSEFDASEPKGDRRGQDDQD